MNKDEVKKKWWNKISQGLKALAESGEYTKTGRYLSEDSNHPNTFRPGIAKKTKTVATAALVAATLATSAQAGLLTPAGGDGANGGGFWGSVWNWISSNFTWGDVATGLSGSGTVSPNATANDLAYAAQQAELGAAKKEK